MDLNGQKPPKRRRMKTCYDRSRDIMRSFYPINQSGSKQAIVAMDPAFEFFPTVTIAKTGQAGVKLPHYAFKTLCDSALYITDYFTDHHDGVDVVNLAPEVIASFEQQYGEKVVTFCNNVQTNGAESVTLNELSWQRFVGLLELLKHNFMEQESWTFDAQQLYEALKEYCKSYFTGQSENHTNMKQLGDFLATLALEELIYVPREECRMDIQRAFLEMKYFCKFDLAGSL
jgi:DNA-binding protein Fis